MSTARNRSYAGQETGGARVAPSPRPVAASITDVSQNGEITHSETGALVGYGRVSTRDQHPELQHDALTAAGCIRIFVDKASGKLAERPALTKALDYVRPGDTLVIWRLSRLGRSLKHLIEIVADLQTRGVGLRSLHEAIDTSTAGGRLVFHIFAALAEFERELIVENTHAGLDAARARGRVGGRPTVWTPERERGAVAMMAQNANLTSIARALGVSRASVYRWVDERREASA